MCFLFTIGIRNFFSTVIKHVINFHDIKHERFHMKSCVFLCKEDNLCRCLSDYKFK